MIVLIVRLTPTCVTPTYINSHLHVSSLLGLSLVGRIVSGY